MARFEFINTIKDHVDYASPYLKYSFLRNAMRIDGLNLH